jgi:hypothetical protein
MGRDAALELLPQLCRRYRHAEIMVVTALIVTFILAMIFALIFFLARGTNPQTFAEVEALLAVCAIVWLFCLGRVTSCANSLSFAMVFLRVDSSRSIKMIEKSTCLRDTDDFCRELLRSLKVPGHRSTGGRS